MVDLCHLALLLVDRQFELPVEVRGQIGFDTLACPLALDQHHQVVGIAHEAMPPSFQFPIQIVKQDIGQQWREGAALRRSQLAGLNIVIDQYARPQVATDEGQQSLVVYPSGHAGHQDVVIDVVEELRQVEIDCDAIAGLDVGFYLLERAVGGAFRSEAETRFGELRIEYRRHDLRDGLLDDPINNGRDAQRAFAPTRLRDTDPSYRLGLIAAIAEALADRRIVVGDQQHRGIRHARPS